MKMDDLLKHEYYNQLFDCYEKLLTTKQQEYFKMYYFLDYSLGEIASSFELSRNAVFDALSKTTKLLTEYEEKLHLLANKKARWLIIEKLEKEYSKELLEELKKID